MRRPRTDLLLHDIAKLVLKYSLDDWLPILRELDVGGGVQKKLKDVLYLLIREAQSAPVRPQVCRKVQAKRKKPPRLTRSRFGSDVAAIIQDKNLVPTLGHLRQLALGMGMKATLPPSRERATDAIIDYLETVSAHQQESVLDLLNRLEAKKRQDAGEDYERWFSVILENPSRSDTNR